MKNAVIILINFLSISYLLSNFCSFCDILKNSLAFPLLLLFPGYMLINALFPLNDKLNIEEKLILSIGFSIIIVIIIGLILNYFKHLTLIYYYLSLYIFILATSAVILFRQFKFIPLVNQIEVNNTTNIKKNLLVFLSLILASSIPFVILFINGISDAYAYLHWAFIEAFKNSNYIDPFLETGGFLFEFVDLYPGYYIFLLAIAKFSDLPINTLQYIPLLGFSISLVSFEYSKKLIGSSFIPLIFTVAIIPLYSSYSFGLSALWPYSLSILFFL